MKSSPRLNTSGNHRYGRSLQRAEFAGITGASAEETRQVAAANLRALGVVLELKSAGEDLSAVEAVPHRLKSRRACRSKCFVPISSSPLASRGHSALGKSQYTSKPF